MILGRLLQFVLFLGFLATIGLTQTNSDQSKQIFNENPSNSREIWLENLIKETANLKLPENRAIVYVRLGKIYRKTDPNRAQQLFRSSIDQLIIAQKEAELERNSPSRNDLVVYGETRQKILDIILGEDEELGFELFEKSRSATVKKALVGISTESAFNTYNGITMDKFITQQENMLEQRLLLRTVSHNPTRVINYLRRTPRPSPTVFTIELLQELQSKEKTIADEIISDIIKQILMANFTINSPEFGFASQLLSEATQTNRLKINNQVLHDIAKKVADFLIKEADRQASPSYTYLTSILIKYLPERTTELNEKTTLPRRSIFEVFPVNKEATDLLNSQATPEKLLSEADRFPDGFREQIYVKATNQIAFEGDIKRAKDILIKNFPKERLPEMFGSLNWQLAYRAMEKGEFDNAFDFIEQANEGSRFEALIHLATAIRAKTPNERQKALSVLAKARASLPEIPNTTQEFTKTGELASAYALIEPEIGFSLLEMLLKKFIEVSEAAAIVDNFQGSSNIRKNEFLLTSGWRGLADLNISLNNFTKADFEKTIKIVSKVPRLDQRIYLELLVLEKVSDG